MQNFCCYLFLAIFLIVSFTQAATSANEGYLLIPMDQTQPEHCQAYGLVYKALAAGVTEVSWLLNYRGGSFLVPDQTDLRLICKRRGINFETIHTKEAKAILDLIQEENMDAIPLEKAPKIAIYLPSPRSSDVVARILDLVGIPFKTVYDKEILEGKLKDFDWLHIHHKDFTGQGHKGRISGMDLAIAKEKGFQKVWQMKQEVATKIHEFVSKGGFLFAMCSAAETIDVALAADGQDFVPSFFDGDPALENINSHLNYEKCFAFQDFSILVNSMCDYSDIDVPSAGGDVSFRLFQFSAQVDSIPTLLNQNHVEEIRGFGGETSSFRKSLVKKTVTILAENNDGVSVRCLTGSVGQGIFTFYGGHTPSQGINGLRESAPGFRLILNNILFPSAKLRKRKT